jgi:hypothetical protein
MVTASRSADSAGSPSRMHVPRTRGAFSGLLLVPLGIWGALIPFVGPIYDYAYTPDDSWHFTAGRFWLEILPGAATVLAGLILLFSANRLLGLLAGWLGSLAGAWFVLGQLISNFWHDGGPAAGFPVGVHLSHRVWEQIGFFAGLGVVILFLSALALGRMSVVGARDLERQTADPNGFSGTSDSESVRSTGSSRVYAGGSTRTAESSSTTAAEEDDSATY